MIYFVYILQSLNNGDIYVGSTENLERRIYLHNSGRVKSTKGYTPWILRETKEFSSRNEAVQYERFSKTGQQKELLKRKYNMAG